MAHFEAEHTLIQINISNLECIKRYKILLVSFLEYHRIISYYILKLKKNHSSIFYKWFHTENVCTLLTVTDAVRCSFLKQQINWGIFYLLLFWIYFQCHTFSNSSSKYYNNKLCKPHRQMIDGSYKATKSADEKREPDY